MSHTLLSTSRLRFIPIAIVSVAVLAAVLLAATGASASSGGIGTQPGSADPKAGADERNLSAPKYERAWQRVSSANKRWARDTSECESGRDPDAIGYGGRYRGAFQFSTETWESSPKSPGGDPIDYSYKTQAVVAVALKLRDGAGHWPVCG